MTVNDFLQTCAYEVDVGLTTKRDPISDCSTEYNQEDFIALNCAGSYFKYDHLKELLRRIGNKKVVSFRNTYDLNDCFDGIIVVYES